MNIIPEPGWKSLLAQLVENQGIVLLIGQSDTGKTCLSKYLLKGLLADNISVSLVDSDIGQSSLGLPGTVSMKTFQNIRDLESFCFDKMFFIGAVNASKQIPFIIDGTKRMVNECKGQSEVTIVDTTGLVCGEEGKRLKVCKINEIKPDCIIAIQRNGELKPILKETESLPVHCISASSNVNPKSAEMRVKYRIEKLKNYFDIAIEHTLNIADIECLYQGESIDIRDKYLLEGAVIGLNNNNDTIALGKISRRDTYSIMLRSPVNSLRGIDRLVFGNLIA